MTANWQNPARACDVDSSSLVTAVDALILINSINRDGQRSLSETAATSNLPFYDVNGDDQITSLDVLRVINAINRAMPELALSATIPDGDADFNGVVASESFLFSGKTGPNSDIGVQVTIDSGATLSLNTSSNETGTFQLTIPLATGLNRVAIHVLDEVGSSISLNGSMRRGSLVSEWNATILNEVRTLGEATALAWTPPQAVQTKPPGIARNLAMIYGAMFDALNAVEGGYESFMVSRPRQLGTNAVAAGSAAAHRVAMNLYSDASSVRAWNATYEASLKLIPDDDSRRRGIELGESIASEILQVRDNDGSKALRDISFGSDPGQWHPSLPSYESVLKQWPNVTPFSVPSIVPYRPSAPPSLTSKVYARAVDEVMRIGSKNSTVRTADQTLIARFWADGSGTASPPGHWNQISVDAIVTRGLSLIEQVRTMALLNVALADAGIVSWDAKYEYELWRPVDAIRNGDVDGNALTTADKNWEPLIVTPAFPSYVSGHSTFSSAAATVLTSLLGGSMRFVSQLDRPSNWVPTRVSVDSSAAPDADVERVYINFREAALEAGMSRVYGGIHFSFDNTVGNTMGNAIGNYVVSHAIKKL